MKVLELFAGTRSIGKAFEAKGHEVFSVEWDKDFENIDLYADISNVTAEEILQKFGKPDVIWASPDCATFSIAAISHHRRRNEETGNLDPISEYAKFCDVVDQHVLKLIEELNPTFYFIENPRGGMRKMTWMQKLPRYTVTYCQYGDSRMKPTDIWTNHPDPQFKPMCKNGDPCHEKAPRGSKTGTQGLKGSKERSVIPEALCKHIVDICEKYICEKENKEMELKVNEYQLPANILFNYEELKAELTEKVGIYESMVYTDDQIQLAKKDKANLNNLKKALNDERIRREKEYMQPFNNFKAQINEIISIIDKPVAVIDKQVKAYEDKQKQDKLEKIKEFFNTRQFPDYITLEKIMDARWLNASVSMKAVQDAIVERENKEHGNLELLANLPEFGFEAKEIYKSTLDITRAISEAKRMSDMQKAKAEARAKAEEEAKRQAEAEKQEEFIPPVVDAEFEKKAFAPETPAKQWISFKALLTTEDALALRSFFNERGIEFHAI